MAVRVAAEVDPVHDVVAAVRAEAREEALAHEAFPPEGGVAHRAAERGGQIAHREAPG